MLWKVVGVNDLDPITNLMAQMVILSNQLGKFNVDSIQTKVLCIHFVGNHPSVDCQVGNPFA